MRIGWLNHDQRNRHTASKFDEAVEEAAAPASVHLLFGPLDDVGTATLPSRRAPPTSSP
jgi:hypothetical protein